MPLVFLHGGPGSGCSPRHRQLVDPERFRIVLFDQRGCGRSTPRGETAANSTTHLVADIERLREHLGIERWLVFGGSWGSSLALAYCAQHPTACLGTILRGIFLTGRADIDWFFRDAGALRPEAWARLVAPLNDAQRANIAEHYLTAVRAPDRDAAIAAVERWMQWETALSGPGRNPPELPPLEGDAVAAALDKYRIQAHYLAHECFIGEDLALKFAAALGEIPTAILHGRQDRVCRPQNALKLHHALPGSRLGFIDDAGHNPFDAPMTEALIGAASHFHRHGDFSAWAPESPESPTQGIE
jgi:proline iminopeptidase